MTINLGSYTIVLTIVCYLTNFLSSYSQVSINPPKNENNFSQLQDVFPIDVQANYGVNYQIIVEINNSQGVLVRGVSPIIEFRTTNIIISTSYFNQFVWEFSNSSDGEFVRNELRFPIGGYLINWILITPEGIEISRSSKNIYVNISKELTNKSKTKSKNFSFTGNAQVNVEYGSRPQMYSQYPNWTVSASLTPNISIYEVPIYANLMYSNIAYGNAQNPFIYSFGYDNEVFKRVLVKRLQNAIGKNKELGDIGDIKNKTLESIQNYDQILNNPEFKKELERIAEVENLQGLYKTYGSLTSSDVLNLDIDGLKKLEEFIPDSLMMDYLHYIDCNGNESLDSACIEFGNKIKNLQKDNRFLNEIKKVQDSLAVVYETYKDILPKMEAYKSVFNNREIAIEKAKLNGWIDSDSNIPNLTDLNKPVIDFSNTSSILNNLESLGLLKKYEKYLMYLKAIQLGTVIKKNSDFTLNNIPVNGVGFEIIPKNIYASFTYGQLLRPIYSLDRDQIAYKRNYISGTIGYGSKSENYIHLTINHSKDDPNSLLPRDSILMYYRKPGQNNQISLDFSWAFMKKKIKVYGELAGSQFIRDLTYWGNDNYLNDSLNLNKSSNWFVNIFKQRPVNFNTTVDFAYKIYVDVDLFKGKTKIILGNERIGPNFYSFGNPYLLKDMFILDANVSQTLFKGKLRMKAGVKRFSDNLNGSGKLLTTSQLRWVADLELKIPKLPSLRVTYMPIIQQNDSGYVNMNMANAMMNYSIRKLKYSAVFTLGYIYQRGVISYSYGNFESQSLILNQMYTIGQKLNLYNVNSIIYSKSNLGELLSYNFNLGFQVPLKKMSLNFNSNTLFNRYEVRLGGGLGTAFNISKYLNWNLMLEYFYYKTDRIENLYYPQYDRISLRSIWNINW